MNKILLVDTNGDGHHKNYAKLVIEAAKEKYGEDVFFLADYEMKKAKNINLEFYNHSNIFLRALLRFFRILKIIKIAKKRNFTNIHFLYLDSLIIISPIIYLLLFNSKFEITATLHHFNLNKMKPIFLKLLSKKLNKIVVHGEYLKKSLHEKSIDNVINIEYPATHNYFIGKEEARKFLGLNKKENILLSLGGTRIDKGLDVLLDALNRIESEKFLLIIAGKEESFSKEFILKKIENYKKKVILDLEYISDKKFSLYLEAGDAVILPYKKKFRGQSGPLTEGVNHNCFIISSNHGQIEDTVKTHNLGTLFEEGNSKDLSEKIRKFLINKENELSKLSDKNYIDFRKSINKDIFKSKYTNEIFS